MGDDDGAIVGNSDGDSDGAVVGATDGETVGECVGDSVVSVVVAVVVGVVCGVVVGVLTMQSWKPPLANAVAIPFSSDAVSAHPAGSKSLLPKAQSMVGAVVPGPPNSCAARFSAADVLSQSAESTVSVLLAVHAMVPLSNGQTDRMALS